MAHTLKKAVYLGNTDDEYCGFTPGNEYDVDDLEEGYFGVCDDNDIHRCVKNGEFHKFGIIEEDGGFITETKCAAVSPFGDKEPNLRYYINGHEVDMVEFGNVRCVVGELRKDGVKCNTIKFEVKFE